MSEGHNPPTRGRPGGLNARSVTAGLLSVAAATAFLATAGAAQAVPPPAPVGAAGIVPSGSARIGALPASTTMQIEVALAPRDPAALSQYASQVSMPGSPLYHQYIARGQFASMFGPTSATVNSVYAALRARGLNPGAISADHLSIPVTATAGQIESAFGVAIDSYRLAGGSRGFANTNSPKLPSDVAPQVQAIIGLDNLTRMRSFATAPIKATMKLTRAIRPAGVLSGGPQPCAAAVNQHNAQGGLTANELASSYRFSDLYHAGDLGSGETVGIVEFGQQDRRSDISAFKACYGIHTSVKYHNLDGFRRAPDGTEETLDIEVVASMAPRAHIIVYQAPNTGKAAVDIYRVIVDQDRARVISESFGLCEHYQERRLANAANTLYEQASVQGQTIVASSGDAGSEACLPNDGVQRRLSVNFPASNPHVLGVGGTTVFQAEPPPNLGETVWNERSLREGAGGGGKSVFYRRPGYQRGFGIKSRVREVPDVAADADPSTGYVVFDRGQGGWLQIGGTSGAAPLWAALLALTDSKCHASPVGWVNPALYHAASKAVKAVVLNDIVAVSGNPNPNNNDYTGRAGGRYPVRRGYDMATGLGTPRAGTLATTLCRLSGAKRGYWLVTARGRVTAEHAPFHGSFRNPGSRVVGIAAAHNNGYWIVTAKGRVKGFGIASRGSVRHPSSPIVGIAPDKSGKGYWAVSSNGHVYAFGGAKRYGGATHDGKVVGIALDRQTGGYWIATASGKVIPRHARRFANKRLSNVTGIAGDPKRQGYWLVTGGGRIHAFGVPSFGSMPFRRVGRTIGIAGDPSRGGYFLATSNGHVAAIHAVWHGDRAGAGVTAIAASH